MSGFSFKLTKTVEKKKVLADSKIRDESTKDKSDGPDFIKDVSDNKITGTLVKKVEEDLVIPLIVANKWRDRKPDDEKENGHDKEEKTKKKKEDPTEGGEKKLSLQEQAIQELVSESRKELEDWRNSENGPEVDQVPLLLGNAVPAGFETEDQLDVSLRAEQSTLEDYDNIPVEKYGMAMLRGMGFKSDEGIGGFKKQVIKTVEPVIRPKGLGLGASKPKKETAKVAEGEEKLELKRGAFVLMESGKQKGLYGTVEGLDEENARVIVKLAIGGEKVSISENSIKLVNDKEYKKWSITLNKDKYEKYKTEDEEKRKLKEDKYNRERSRSRSPAKKKYKEEKRDRSRSRSPKRKTTRTWIRPYIYVRCIDKKFKKGAYYNKKMEVKEVVSNDSCNCVDEDGRMVYNVDCQRLETVIPKRDGDKVQVVLGKHLGQIGKLISRNKSSETANICLLSSGDVISKYYDEVCLYLGPVDEDDLEHMVVV